MSEKKCFDVGDYHTIVARSKEEAVKFYYSEVEPDDTEEVEVYQTNAKKDNMFFPADAIPAERLQELLTAKVEMRNYEGELHVLITKAEAMRYREDNVPYILSISSDLL